MVRVKKTGAAKSRQFEFGSGYLRAAPVRIKASRYTLYGYKYIFRVLVMGIPLPTV